jgi:hypothetical protein
MIFPEPDIRNQIISILTEEFPLSFRKINNKLRSDYSKSISDKALYRILALMVKENILINDDHEFSVNSKWLDNLDKFVEKISKKYISGNITEKEKRNIYSFTKQECSCKKGFAEGFCFVCNEPVCSKCGEKTRLHYSCNTKCEYCSDEFAGKCANCLKDACSHCSKEVWSHFSENCIKKPEKVVVGILEVDHECWFADLSEKLDNPIVLDSFMDDKDPILKTHSGRVIIEKPDQYKAINFLLKHKQITEVKPLSLDKKVVLRTRALFKQSVDESVRKNKSILLNPINATDTKERNLIISPSKKEIMKLLRVLNQSGKCRIIDSEEVDMGSLNEIRSKAILSFVNTVNKSDLISAIQRIRLMKRIAE